MATKKELILINNYWLSEFDHLEKDYPTCFVCGKETHLQLCHLIPNKQGGSKDLSNIVLLCSRCHSDSPNTVIPQIMLDWIHEEALKYEQISHIKYDDILTKFKYLYTIYTRLKNTFGNVKNITDILPFITTKLHNDVLFVPQFYEANRNTFNLYYKYLSEYNNLEEDYLHYLLNKEE